MALSETRIVIFEKVVFRSNLYNLLDQIEFRIKSSMEGWNGKCIHVPCRWLRHKMIRKILEENGFKIIIVEESLVTKITWN